MHNSKVFWKMFQSRTKCLEHSVRSQEKYVVLCNPIFKDGDMFYACLKESGFQIISNLTHLRIKGNAFSLGNSNKRKLNLNIQ